MTRRYFYCEWDTAPIGERRKPCGKPVIEGRLWCPEHAARMPLWPEAEDVVAAALAHEQAAEDLEDLPPFVAANLVAEEA